MDSSKLLVTPGSENIQNTESSAPPKFTSFKAKQKAKHGLFTEADPLKRPTGNLFQRTSGHKSRHRSVSHSREGRTGPSEIKDQDVYLITESSQSDEYSAAKHTYKIDRTGDQKNLQFESLDRDAIPAYKPIGRHNLIGLRHDDRIEQIDCDRTKIVVTSKGRSLPESTYSLSRSKANALSCTDEEPLIPSSASPNLGPQGNYIPLDCSYKKAKGTSDATYNSPPLRETRDGRVLTVIGQTQPLYDRHSRNLPADANLQNLETWSRLIADAASEVRDQNGNFAGLAPAARRVVADVRISMCEKALQHVTEPRAKECLIVSMMHEARFVWDASKIRSKWETILNTRCQSLWVAYVDYLQTTPADFTFDHVRRAYIQCLGALRHAKSAFVRDDPEQMRIFELQIHTVLQMSQYEIEAGYHEFASSTWQALLEFLILDPARYQTSNTARSTMEQKLEAFELFWDNEGPRIGEPDSHRSAQCNVPEPTLTPPLLQKSIMTSQDYDMSSFERWAMAERQCSVPFQRFARTGDETNDEDPFRVVMYSDIRHALLEPPPSSSIELVIEAFLKFCHLPCCGIHCSNDQGHDFPGVPGIQPSHQSHCSSTGPFNMGVSRYQTDQQNIFPPEGWFDGFQGHVKPSFDLPVTHGFVQNILHAMVREGVGGDKLAEYSLAFELHISPATVKKRAKRYLKWMPYSLRLYNALALIDYRLCKPSQGEGIILKALGMMDHVGDEAGLQRVLLWRTWIWELVRAKEHLKALQRIVLFGFERDIQQRTGLECPPDQTKASIIMQTEERLTEMRNTLLHSNLFELAVAAAECLVLLAYIQDPSSLDAAASVFKANLILLQPFNSAYAECLHQSFAHILFCHTTHTKYFRLADIRTFLEESLASFPMNTIFLSLYARNERRLSIDDRLRSRVHSLALQSQGKSVNSIIPYVFLIDVEFARHEHDISNLNGIRSAFKRALTSDACAHHAGLWKRYVIFELDQGNNLLAEEVLYRAIHACPWVKDFFMLAFERLSGQHNAVERAKLESLFVLMEERGMRLHGNLGH